ncbi:metallophosphoesterase [Arthrobacter sp. ERGS1:01]|uniref:polynucleotide kinase-phosphatase n=1 Tax=Arthrobacter sp. ERGS1:01 TaxID=1704044 RepID=UPI0006B42120|nr:polynucleotide kinase-phosphatase [Arthrobacter sp. ERGS1:01]ALE07505.1 metallophosphoesterase [Arthrobacter sp. ERGS1:01]
MAELGIPQLCLLVLVGASGAGKSTFARQHFHPFEVLSSDFFRGLVSNDENDQGATKAAFESLMFVAGKRLDAGLLTVVDATSVQAESRRELIRLARDHDVLPVAVVLDLPMATSIERDAQRSDRQVGARVIRRQADQLRRSLKSLGREGFRKVHVLHNEAEVAAASFKREPLLNDFRQDVGPFDVIGDVHGCLAELEAILAKLGYRIDRDADGRATDAAHPEGRKAIFVGDLVDRGPDSPGVLRLVMGMVRNGHARSVPGNHEDKLVRALRGKKVQTGHGLAETLAQLASEPADFRAEVLGFCEGLVSHLVLDGGKLVVAHAGLLESYHGRASARVRAFALYGDTTGETDVYGLPVRYPWAEDYRGAATVLYGHTPTVDAEWVNGTMCLDTGCVFGGKLTALRYPEKEVVTVPAERIWCEPVKPLAPAPGAEPERAADMLRIDDVLGRQVIETGTHGRIGIREQYAAGALEVMSRWAIDPRWLPYLPPTMTPAPASEVDGYLEHPGEAFAVYRKDGVEQVVCEEKHMGSRVVVLLSRNAARFAAPDGWRGTVYTRTGRPFFQPETTDIFLARLDDAMERAGLWAELDTDWILLDAELLPWSLKAGEMIRNHYAAVGAAATTALGRAVTALEQAADGGADVAELLARTVAREQNAADYVAAYRRYSAPAEGLEGVQVAPFQVLATEGRSYSRTGHDWHLGITERLAAADPELIRPTQSMVVDVRDQASTDAGTLWWTKLTESGGEGMVVKPLANLSRGTKGMVQPGIKVRGREYLRIIYGPDYTEPHNLGRLRNRNEAHKRSMASREYALGLEAVERLVGGEPLWRIHQAVFAVLAMESEAVDPRL